MADERCVRKKSVLGMSPLQKFQGWLFVKFASVVDRVFFRTFRATLAYPNLRLLWPECGYRSGSGLGPAASGGRAHGVAPGPRAGSRVQARATGCLACAVLLTACTAAAGVAHHCFVQAEVAAARGAGGARWARMHTKSLSSRCAASCQHPPISEPSTRRHCGLPRS